MNVLIVHASPRRKGVTSTLLSEIQAAIDPAHKIETVRIHDLDIMPWRAGGGDAHNYVN